MSSSNPSLSERTSTRSLCGASMGQLDVSTFRVESREQAFASLRKVYQQVQENAAPDHQQENASDGMILISGTSGTGKSTIVHQFIEEVEMKSKLGRASKPLFLTGKNNGASGSDSYSVIITALGSFAQTLMMQCHKANENDDAITTEAKRELQRLRALIRENMETEVHHLVRVIPQLKYLVTGSATTLPEPSSFEDTGHESYREDGAEDSSLLKHIFQAFVKAISTKERPLVLFLDDLQWVDDASLELLTSLTVDPDLSHFMFIGAYRSDEVKPGDRLWSALEEIQMAQEYETIELSNLSQSDLALFVTQVLQLQRQSKRMKGKYDQSRVLIAELADVLHKKTDGNLFFAIQTMMELEEKGVLTFSMLTSQWELDWTRVDKDAFLTDDLMMMITKKVTGSSDILQKILKTMAYSKSPMDIAMLQELWDGNRMEPSLQNLVETLDHGTAQGLLSHNIGSPDYAFANDKIQQAALTLVPKGERDEYLSSMGMRLLKMYNRGVSEDWTLFVAADHLNASTSARSEFSLHLNLKAAKKAASIAAYDTAAGFLRLAMDHIIADQTTSPWQTKYDLALKTHQKLANVLLRQGNYDEGKVVAETLLANAQTIDDKLPTVVALTDALGKEQKHKESMAMCLDTLCQLKEFPKGKVGVVAGLLCDLTAIKRFFKKHTDKDVLNLPIMKSERKKQVTTLMTSAVYQASYSGDLLINISVSMRLLRIALKHGLCVEFIPSICTYGLVADATNDIELRDRLVRLSKKVMKKLRATSKECGLVFIETATCDAWNTPTHKLIAMLDRGCAVGMKNGRYEDALLARLTATTNKNVAGFPLPALILEIESILRTIRLYSLDMLHNMAVEHLDLYQILTGTKELDYVSLGAFSLIPYDPEQMFERLLKCLTGMEIGVYFGNLRFGEKMIAIYKKLPNVGNLYFIKSQYHFFATICNTSLYHQTQKKSYMCKARKSYKELTTLASVRGDSCLHRCKIMKAQMEVAPLKSKKNGLSKAQALFDETIEYASKTGHKHDAGVGSQLAAEYCLSVKCREPETEKISLSLAYFVKARDFYKSWGADALVSHIENRIESVSSSRAEEEI